MSHALYYHMPFPKFVLFKDTAKYNSNKFILDILHIHGRDRIVYCAFEYNRKLRGLINKNVEIIDFFRNKENVYERLLQVCETPCYMIIDSLAHLIYRLGKDKTYRCLQQLIVDEKMAELVTTLHLDMFDEDDVMSNYLKYLATLTIHIESGDELSYEFRGRKTHIDQEVNSYTFNNMGILNTKLIKKPERKTEITPENVHELLTTFKLDLNEHDKKLKEDLILPYLPKDDNQAGGTGEISYKFDDVDDWDEEDPDDDLDI